jgi:hypothetical protein
MNRDCHSGGRLWLAQALGAGRKGDSACRRCRTQQETAGTGERSGVLSKRCVYVLCKCCVCVFVCKRFAEL